MGLWKGWGKRGGFLPLYFSSSRDFQLFYLNCRLVVESKSTKNRVERKWNEKTTFFFFFPTSIFSFGIEKKRTRTLQIAFIPSIPLTTKFLERTQNCPHCLSLLHFNYWPQTTYEEIGEVGRWDRITQTSPTGCKRQPDKNQWMFLHTSDVWSTLTPNWLWSSVSS